MSDERNLQVFADSFKNGENIVIGSRPSRGKTTLGLKIISSLIANRHVKAAFISLEMSKDAVQQRLLDYGSKIDTGSLIINDNPNITVSELLTTIKSLAANEGVIVFCIDYLDLIQGMKGSNIHQDIKKLASELNIVIISLCQLARTAELEKPKLKHLVTYADDVAIYIDKIYLLDRPKVQENKILTLEIIEAKINNDFSNSTFTLNLSEALSIVVDFTHLHIHSDYSLLRSTESVKDLVSKAASLGMKHLALTDIGNMFGVPDFIKACREAAINPIIGSEFYCTHGSRFDKTESKYHHLVLLASNNEGYKNLLKLSSYSYTEGFYKLPRIDDELLERHHKGLISLSGSINETRTLWYQQIFGKDNFFFELSNPCIENQINQSLVKISECTGIPLVATDELNFKSGDEMAAIFKDYPEAITNTVRIAERCKVDIPLVATKDLPRYLPDFETPAAYPSSKAYLHDLTMKGLKKRYPGNDSAKKRAEYELGIIDEKGFDGYFLIVADYANWARGQGIPVGPGRGSAPSSLVAYAIGITSIDPIRYNLPFERFINPERDSPPDFDIDFSAENRDRVIDYVSKKYGENHVSHIVTFGKRGTAKEDKHYYTSIHAAGLVIGKTSLEDYVPLYRDPKTGTIATQYVFYELEDFGLSKFDFLGLKTLDVLKKTEELVRRKENAYSDFTIANIPLDDIPTYDLFQKGDTQNVFQFESKGIQDILRQFRPDCFFDIALLNASYHPGFMEYLPMITARKQGTQAVEYPHPCLRDILQETYGIIVFQEQIMEIIHLVTAYDMGKSDSLRRILMKRNDDQIRDEKERFVLEAAKHGFLEQVSGDLFSTILSASQYAFNKSHAIAYSLTAYQTAYLKANFLEEFTRAFSESM